MARTLSLVNLAPDIIVVVMQGKMPPEMTLAKAVNNLPEDLTADRSLYQPAVFFLKMPCFAINYAMYIFEFYLR